MGRLKQSDTFFKSSRNDKKEEFADYGIPVRGGMIIPDTDHNELRNMVRRAANSQFEEAVSQAWKEDRPRLTKAVLAIPGLSFRKPKQFKKLIRFQSQLLDAENKLLWRQFDVPLEYSYEDPAVRASLIDQASSGIVRVGYDKYYDFPTYIIQLERLRQVPERWDMIMKKMAEEFGFTIHRRVMDNFGQTVNVSCDLTKDGYEERHYLDLSCPDKWQEEVYQRMGNLSEILAATITAVKENTLTITGGGYLGVGFGGAFETDDSWEEYTLPDGRKICGYMYKWALKQVEGGKK